jgi:hypothetical protein
MKQENKFAGIFCAVLCILSAATAWSGEISISDHNQKVENDQSITKIERVATSRYTPKSSQYIVRGKIRYNQVEGDAYLEMWNVLPDGSRYFSRTLAPSGTMGIITGSSDWRAFELPFNLMETRPKYVLLEINVIMSGKGMIELSPMVISEPSPAWFSAKAAGLWGGIGGGAIGTLVGLFGAFCGRLTGRGKGRRLIQIGSLAGLAAGGVLLAAGICALVAGQPPFVWNIFLIPGIILLILMPLLWHHLTRRYMQVELRKMQAHDA